MALQRFAARTCRALLDTSDGLLRQACADGHTATLVVPAHAWGTRRKLRLAQLNITGVAVATHAQWVEGLWNVHGDGTRLVSAGQRTALLRGPLEEALGSPPSCGLLRDFAAFAGEALVLPAPSGLSQAQQRVCAAIGEYARALEEHGLTELAQAEEALLAVGALAGMVVCEQPDASCAHERRFYEALAQQGVRVAVLERALDGAAPQAERAAAELSALCARLYSGTGGVKASGAVMAAQAHGAHVEGELVARVIRRFADAGTPYEDMLAVFARASDSYPQVQDALVQASIPFECAFELPLQRTAFGAAFIALETWAAHLDDDAAWRDATEFAASPFSGVHGPDARALQAQWRRRAGSSARQRLEDVHHGFKAGALDARDMAQRLASLPELLAASRPQRVRLMFAHGQSAGRAGLLADDAQAADALLDYLEACESVGCEPQLQDMRELPVRLERAFGEQGAGVRLVGVQDCGLEDAACVVFGSLDAAHFPMARFARLFDVLLERYGIAPADDVAARQRFSLLDVLECARERFAFYRVCHTKEGDESGQSALFDELVEAYYGPEDAQKGPGQIPGALEPYALGLSEAQVFADAPDSPSARVAVCRGSLEAAATARQLAQDREGDAIAFSPTALEDYYRCPYRWFTSRRAGYHGMDNEFDVAAQGDLAHAFFDSFYRALHQEGHARVTEQNLSFALALADGVFDEVVARGMEKPRTRLFLRSEGDRLACEDVRRQVRAFIERDAAFLPGFFPTHLELTLGRGDGGQLTYAAVPVHGKVDRVDVDGQGRAVVIDYKLSSLSAGYGLDAGRELPLRIQTDIYAVLVQRHFERLGEPVRVVGSVYRSYAANMLRGVYEAGLDFGPVEVTRPEHDAMAPDAQAGGYGAYLERVEQRVAECLARLGAGDIAPRPLAKGVCEYCKAVNFCPAKEA